MDLAVGKIQPLIQQGNEYKVESIGPEGKPGVFPVKYTFGHYPLQQYLVDIGKGHLQSLNVAWDSRSETEGGQRWFHLQADEDVNAEHPFFWTGHFLNWNSRCAECHSTNLEKNFDPINNSFQTLNCLIASPAPPMTHAANPPRDRPRSRR